MVIPHLADNKIAFLKHWMMKQDGDFQMAMRTILLYYLHNEMNSII